MNQASVSKEAKTAQKVRIFKSPSGTLVRPVKVGGLVISPNPYLRVQTAASKQESQIVELQPHEVIVQTHTTPRKKTAVSNVTPITYQSSSGHYTTAQSVQYTKAQSQHHKPSAPYVIVQPDIDYSEYIVDTSQSEDPEDIYYNSCELEPDTESIESVVEYLNATTALIESDYDGLAYRYRTILEDLLCLRNSFVRKTITHAIRQKLYFQTSGELLDVIFKSFEIILESVKIDQLPLNVSNLAPQRLEHPMRLFLLYLCLRFIEFLERRQIICKQLYRFWRKSSRPDYSSSLSKTKKRHQTSGALLRPQWLKHLTRSPPKAFTRVHMKYLPRRNVTRTFG